jgi:hypothetical protein
VSLIAIPFYTRKGTFLVQIKKILLRLIKVSITTLSVLKMSQSDNSLFHTVIRLFFILISLGFSASVLHKGYQNVSTNKAHYAYTQKIVNTKLYMDAYLFARYPKNYKPKNRSKF